MTEGASGEAAPAVRDGTGPVLACDPWKGGPGALREASTPPPRVSHRWALGPLAALVLAAAPFGRAHAQEPEAAPRYSNVISANPFGLVLLLFNAEYERAATTTSTFGLGGSYISTENDAGIDEEYLNADVFWRFYPGANVYDGWAFGAKAGVTRIPDEGTFFGFGFDVNRSWLLGANDNFYVGAGFGLKRLVGTGDRDLELEVIPTLRIVNIGLAF